ncbi:hypothetical protein M406DRAFT_248892 [Cryphonectria parasitica EP155]|uniref:SAP domain-containing protein n=1 Tax=Cryphonectria parasitica (strain ATCC 38755 / EP155) TaxID=660469 RepID=A0A9P4YCT9_CRYP1|nr:uncharacterized protein M406DRAFT_248892 [Cryphonectria parasitica EP155]KAF3770639.1 hypothetical protein M406DRAFT_248892 [Cryphonectria parasitica EP155]
MTDYASLKVPDLKKLLSERSLPQSGNKADLIARLQEHDKSTSHTDPKPAAAPVAAAEAAPAAPAPAPASAEPAESTVPPTAEAPAETDSTPAAAAPEKSGAAATATETAADKPAETSSFALGLSATEADAEQKKRDDRAKRFGITVDKESDEVKKNERAKRFGIETSAVPKGLDEALPERRPKRGREHGDDGQRGGKRQSLDNRNGRGRNNNQNNRKFGGGRRAGGGGGGGGGTRNQARGGGNVLDDPTEKAKAERRAKRFGGDN